MSIKYNGGYLPTVGADGSTLVANSSAATGLSWAGQFQAGKNKVINGDFGVWQRGTSFSNPSSGSYVCDRFFVGYDGTSATRTISQQPLTPASISGYDAPYFFRWNQSVAGSGGTYQAFTQRIENAQTLSNQSVTFSFWAKADTTRTVSYNMNRNYGSGGTSTDYNIIGSSVNFSVTTSWQRFTTTVTIPTLSGKTIGAGSYLEFTLFMPTNATFTVDIWGVQLEAGSVATAFQTATGTLQGELALAMRYYQRFGTGLPNARTGFIMGASSTTALYATKSLAVPMRTTISAVDYSNLGLTDGVNATVTVTAVSLNSADSQAPNIQFTVASGLTQYRPYEVINNNNSAGYIGLSAEL